jgi:NAD(P)-dependent dehydrogenase (short-subunit alcohol dehydrogenase family)
MIHVVIVGGSKGLGKVVAEKFLSRGCMVTILSRTPPVFCENLRHISVDLNTLKDATDLTSEVIKIGGNLRYLIFCQRYRGDGDAWTGEIQVSLTATKLLIDAFSNYFLQGTDCAIGVVSSVYAQFVGSSQPAGYHVAKAGLNQLVKYNAWVLGKKGVRINSIMPLTYLKEESKEYYLENPKLINLYQKLVPLQKMGSAEDSANLLVFLCSEKAAFINGQSIYVDGGVSVIWPEELSKQLLDTQ